MKNILKFYSLPLRILVRPINGFYEMKFEKKGTLRVALLNLLLVCISYAFYNQYTSILVNARHPLNLHSIFDSISVIILLVLFCASNWAVTSLTDGEGKFIEIVMAICYAMTPFVLILIPATLFSNILTIQETGFFNMLISFSVIYFLFLSFIGLVVVHNYTVAKAIFTMLLTFVAILIILFLVTLLITMLQQLYTFIWSLYLEISFRA